jgi:type III pantothenate kinase
MAIEIEDKIKRQNQRGMILAIDMGNTNIVIGCVDDEKIYFEERISTNHLKTELEYAIDFKTILEIYHIEREEIKGAIISSVVPQLINVIKTAVEKIVGLTPLIVGPGVKTGLNILMDQPRQLGSDLVVDAVAALHEYGTPAIVIDIGTATTISVVDDKENYVGGVILPGVRVSVDSLVSRTAQLPRISLEAPKRVIGKNTVECMQSGIIYGNASCIDGMIDRMSQELCQSTGKVRKDIKVIATGGLASVIIPYCKNKIIQDANLLLKGLKVIYDKNVDKEAAKC